MSKTMRKIDGYSGRMKRTQPYKRLRSQLTNLKAEYLIRQGDEPYLYP